MVTVKEVTTGNSISRKCEGFVHPINNTEGQVLLFALQSK